MIAYIAGGPNALSLMFLAFATYRLGVVSQALPLRGGVHNHPSRFQCHTVL